MKVMYPQLENSATLQDSVCQMQLLKRILIHVDDVLQVNFQFPLFP